MKACTLDRLMLCLRFNQKLSHINQKLNKNIGKNQIGQYLNMTNLFQDYPTIDITIFILLFFLDGKLSYKRLKL